MGHGAGGRVTPPAHVDADTAKAVAETMQALATPSRLRILGTLRQGPRTVGDLADAVGMERSAVSHQLRLLRQLGLVDAERSGRTIIYALYDSHVAMLLDEAVYHAEHLRLGVRDPWATGPRARAPGSPAASGRAPGQAVRAGIPPARPR